MSKRTTASEAEISRAIMDYLAARHVFSLRMNSGTRIGEYKGKKRAIHMHAPGTADMVIFPKGRVIWCEVKSATGKQSELQRSFQTQVEEQGHRYIIARSTLDVAESLK